ncbi:recombinase zinc beta ribbon domain-containing protein, partial [candidate division KSB1 bacterium]|nr:recombinase zinc beta ribbon domain-containing protein [candidate division KSB1 bacterium]
NHYLLRGLLKCKRCSRAMVGYNQEKKRADGSSFYYFTYYCSGGKKNPNSGGTGCKIPSVLGYQVEDFVWKEVKKIVKSPSILTEALEAKQGNNSLKNFDREIKIVQIQLSQKKCALNKDFELFEEGAITKDLITGRIRKLEKEIDELSAHVKDLEKNREEQKQTIVRNGSLKTQLKSLSGELERYTDEEKSRFLNLILEKIEIDCMKRIEKRESKFKVWLYFNSFFLKKLRNYPNKNKRLLHNGGF